jgi:hypothetical protein
MRISSLAVRGLAHLSRAALRPRGERFERDLDRPDRAQRDLLGELVAALAGTGYGRHHGIGPRDGYAAFSAKLPVTSYETLAPWIARQMAGEGRTLVAEPVRFYQTTSGSAGPAKQIPYSGALITSFGRLFALWLYDLLAHGPPLVTGRTWISISPALGPRRRTARGIRVGVDDDREYLTGGLRALARPFLVLPPDVSRLRDARAFTHVAALFLLATDPEIVSVWNPTFLTVLLDHVAGDPDALARDWTAGRIVRDGVAFRVPAPPADRLAALRRAPLDWAALLPGLRLVSCWADAGARPGAEALRRRLPGVTLQGKGLLATEAPMTLPWSRAEGFVPLVGEVFFEFEDDAGRLRRLHELEPGATYAVVVSQRGGLSRYRIGDRVRVSHLYRGTPCLAFVGREGNVSDLVGEKLHEAFVAEALDRLGLRPDGFRTLLPVRRPDGRGYYALVVDRLDASASGLAWQLDARLQEAHRYREARLLGQLGPARVRVLADAPARWLAHFAARGMRLGDVKPAVLGPEVAADSPLAAA